MHLPDGTHLAYCLNVHRGETWTETFAALRRYPPQIHAQFAPRIPFGLGLRLSAAAAAEMMRAKAIEECRAFLDARQLYAFTVNGFPFGAFHGQAVKTAVYRPDWRSADRRDYTLMLADILAALLPEDLEEGSISTVPGSYRAWIADEADVAAMVRHLTDTVAHLAAIRTRCGKTIHLGLEPEPDCYLETTEDCLRFFNGPLRTIGVPYLRQVTGWGSAAAELTLQRHLGVCFDACHLAVQFEDLADALQALHAAGILISKVQLSAALVARPASAAGAQLAAFADPVYLHQVRRRRHSGDRLVGYADLPEALSAVGAGGETPPAAEEEWRIHFHVPLYWQGQGALQSTAALLDDAFWRALRAAGVGHLEIETYTFDVLPPDLRWMPIEDSIAREYAWVLDRSKNRHARE
jgi:sugar phosphate isomerase/epimerase